MPSAPTTSIDLTEAAFVADPYPRFTAERERLLADGAGGVAWHEPSGMWLTFTHASAGAVLRNRKLQRLWQDLTPADYLEPFNLLHRNQMMENEPPVHTRLRRSVSAAFNRGHVERLRPRVRELAADLLAEAGDGAFDVIGDYAEPLPVLVIAELLGVPRHHAPQLRDWSQAIVKMYEVDPSPQRVDDAVAAATRFGELIGEVIEQRRARPADDLISDLLGTELSEDELVASIVLLLNAGHEASVNVFGNGLAAMLERGLRPATDEASVTLAVEEMLRYDSALQLFERTAVEPVQIGDGDRVVTVEPGQKIAALLGAANRDPAVFTDADTMDLGRDPNPHVAFGAGVHFCLGAPLARMELVESVTTLFTRYPDLKLAAPPVSRGTFVLRGNRTVPVTGTPTGERA